MPRPKRDHSSSLKALCVCCGRKPPGDGNLRSIKEEWVPAIAKFVPGFSTGSNLIPQSICSTCRKIVSPLVKDLNAQLSTPGPVLVDWDKVLPRSSRSAGKSINTTAGEVCPCGICDIARLNGAEFNAWHKNHSRPAGLAPNPPTVKTVIKRCGDCLSEIGPGKPHSCSKTEKRANLTNMVRSNSANTKSNVVANTLKTIADDQGASTRGGEVLLQSGGPNKLLVKIGRGRNDQKDRIITHEDLKKLQLRVGCSDAKLKIINQFLASVLGQKKLEPYLSDALVSRNRDLQDFFRVSKLTFNKGPKGKVELVENTVILVDIPALITFLLEN